MRAALLVSFAVIATALAAGCQKSDRRLVRGEWVIASIESADGNKDAPEELQAITVLVKGNRLSVRHASQPGGMSALFTLDPTKEPKEIDAPEMYATEGREEKLFPGPGRGIYKFEGEEHNQLVIAFTIGEGKDLPRPNEFKPSASPDKKHQVVVLHLKRKEGKP